MMMPLMLMIGACIGVNEDDQPALDPAIETKSAGQALMSPLDRRRIPIRAIAQADSDCETRPAPLCGTTCSGHDGELNDTRLQQGIAIANEIYAAAGVEFYLRSFTRVESPALWCSETTAHTWADVKSTIMAGFPEVPANAWPDTTVKGTKPAGASFTNDWWHATAATYAPDDEIVMVINGRHPSNLNAADFPHVGRIGFMIPGSLDDAALAHELGHYVGLAHVFQAAGGQDPDTGLTWKKADRYDLMFRSTTSGPVFFGSKAAATPFESSLALISPSCTYEDITVCDVSCTLAGDTFVPGDPELDGVARLYPDGVVGLNVMDYQSVNVCNRRHISDSQAHMIWSFLNREPPITTQFIERVGTLPTGYTKPLITARPRLGLVRGTWSTARNFCRAADEHLYSGDFNGDGRMDLLCNQDDGDMFVDLANTNGEFWVSDWSLSARNFCRAADEHLYVGDFNGDGRDDLLCNQDDGDMFVDLASTSGEFLGSDWSLSARNFCRTASEHLYVGDFNGDGRDDLLCNQDDGDIFVDLASTSGEFLGSDWSLSGRNFCNGAGKKLYVGDFNGDGRDDALCNQTNGAMAVDLANTSGQFWSSEWSLATRNFCTGSNATLYVGDFNNDGRSDLMCRDGVSGKTEIDLSDASGQFLTAEWRGDLDGWCTGATIKDVHVGNADGQFGSDIVCNETDGTLNVAKVRME
ncbi:FG-GAP-like repeat-containing protein [Sorangium sp. So ce726]|uniref:FG-GAP repeat domain-containing protein n=1 Tax=Sorangium sp. So ce726 TaxID=3133319 RepID=UPI003F5F8E36